jgi:Tripartite tricarboxylate transporter family receptor
MYPVFLIGDALAEAQALLSDQLEAPHGRAGDPAAVLARNAKPLFYPTHADGYPDAPITALLGDLARQRPFSPVGDFVPGFEASSWYGLGAPMNTPAEIVGVLNKEINAALADPKIKARLTDLGSPVLPGSPADFGKLITAETEKWGKVIRMANIKPQ